MRYSATASDIFAAQMLRAGHPHPIINAQFIRHKAQVGADTIRPKEERKLKKKW